MTQALTKAYPDLSSPAAPTYLTSKGDCPSPVGPNSPILCLGLTCVGTQGGIP